MQAQGAVNPHSGLMFLPSSNGEASTVNKIKQFLIDWNIDYRTVSGTRESVDVIVNDIISIIGT